MKVREVANDVGSEAYSGDVGCMRQERCPTAETPKGPSVGFFHSEVKLFDASTAACEDRWFGLRTVVEDRVYPDTTYGLFFAVDGSVDAEGMPCSDTVLHTQRERKAVRPQAKGCLQGEAPVRLERIS